MKIGVPRETHPNERRVAATPESVERLVELGYEVLVEAGAGARADFPDAAYEQAGATIADGAEALWSAAELVLKVRAPGPLPDGGHEADRLGEGARVLSFLRPAENAELLERLAARRATVLAMDQIPRITRAQKMDALSSMASIAGYRAIVEAAWQFGSLFTGQYTAAGRIPPARVLVIGAGVAGLQAIATARAMGAEVAAFDTRLATKEQVESLGGEFLVLDLEQEGGEGGGGYAKVMSEEFIEAEMALFREKAPQLDIVVTTALIPGKPAPRLWTKDMVEAMPAGSVVVDLAGEQGGNCDLTEADEVVHHEGVTVLGYTDLPSRLPKTASKLYAANVVELVAEMTDPERGWHVDLDDDVVRSVLLVHEGEITWPPPEIEEPAPPKPADKPEEKAPAPAEKEAPGPTEEKEAEDGRSFGWLSWLVGAAALAGWIALKVAAPEDAGGRALTEFLQHLTVFVLACFVGWQVIWAVTPALHTPLMSITNAISGIIVLGGILHASGELASAEVLLALAAVFFAMINVSGGFLVTRRMLRMFRR